MKLWIPLLFAASVAHADSGERCAKGKELAASSKELARAALYLEICTDDDGVRLKNSVVHKLEASQLSLLTISSLPDGAIAEIDAFPGEQLTTPVSVWVKPGTYRITINGATVEKSVEARSRTSVIVNAPPPKKEPKSGVVSFEDEPAEKHEGPPPAQKWGTMMPKKYLKPGVSSGEQIDDPFARSGDSALAWRLGLRAGGGIFDRTTTAAGFGVSLAALASRPLDGPFMLNTRLDWSHTDLDTIGTNVGVSYIALAGPAFVLSTGVALRGEVRVQDQLNMTEVARAGIGAAADVDLAVLALPIALGLRVEQGFTEVLPGARNRAVLFELGYDWR